MGIERLKQIKIVDEDIAWVEAIMGFHFDGDRFNIIKNLESLDIQAFPGSGKQPYSLLNLRFWQRSGHTLTQEHVFIPYKCSS